MAYVIYTGGKSVKHKHHTCPSSKREAQDQARAIRNWNPRTRVTVRKVKSCASAPRSVRAKR